MIHLLGLTAHPPQSYRKQRGRQCVGRTAVHTIKGQPGVQHTTEGQPGVQHTIEGQSRCAPHHQGPVQVWSTPGGCAGAPTLPHWQGGNLASKYRNRAQGPDFIHIIISRDSRQILLLHTCPMTSMYLWSFMFLPCGDFVGKVAFIYGSVCSSKSLLFFLSGERPRDGETGLSGIDNRLKLFYWLN